MTPERRRLIADLAAVTLLILVGVIGFAPTFDSPQYLVGALGGLALGLALAWVGARWHWGVLSVAGSTVAVYLLLGGMLALPHTAFLGVVPTLETWRQLVVGTVTSWKQLLTTVPPVAAGDGHLVVPFLLTLAVAVVAGSLALRVRRPEWALLPILAYLALQILLGVASPAAPIVQGILFTIVVVVWLALRVAWSPETNAAVSAGPAEAARSARGRRLIAAGAVLAIASGVGVATGALASPGTPRYVLRDFVVPPFDVHQFASPLQSFRGIVRDQADQTLFTVTGLPEDGRVRLATMDAYDGVVYNVASEGAGSSSAFTPVRSNMSPQAAGDPATVRVEIEALGGPWLPDVGAAREFIFDGPRAQELRRSTHFNDATGTAVTTLGLQPGDAYTLETVIPTFPSDSALGETPFASLKTPVQDGIPAAISEQASAAVEDAETPIERARALESWLHTTGYFSHGIGDDVFSPSGHSAARILALLSGDQMIGDDEQYAVTMALMATQLGMPARVVMGWYPGEDEAGSGAFEATGDNLHAWVEIAFEGHGWIPFDPTPDEDNEPSEQNTKPRANPRPQVLQPPPPAQEAAELPPVVADERDQEEEEESGLEWLGPLLFWGGISLLTLFILLSPVLLIAALKAARRIQRRSAERAADRISGGWDELVDRAVDLRVPVTPGGTRAESAREVGSAYEADRVGQLATRADRGVYGPGDPTPEEIEEFWIEVDDIIGGMRASTPRRARLRALLSTRSLRRSRRRRGDRP